MLSRVFRDCVDVGNMKMRNPTCLQQRRRNFLGKLDGLIVDSAFVVVRRQTQILSCGKIDVEKAGSKDVTFCEIRSSNVGAFKRGGDKSFRKCCILEIAVIEGRAIKFRVAKICVICSDIAQPCRLPF